MHIVLTRKFKRPLYTIGTLAVDGEYFCDTLEDPVRPAGQKVPGQTAVPAGVYEAVLTLSPRFKRVLPLLLDVPGFGPGLLHLWRVLRETLARYMEGPVRQREVAANPESIARMAQARLAGRTEEEVWVALLTQANALIAWERLRQGSIDHVPILPRDVFAIALQRKASGIILVHNHPGGNTTPSQPDLTLTGVLRQQALPLGLRLLDHIIVTDGACYSILQSRYLRSDTDPAT